jgi:hypothetical protein
MNRVGKDLRSYVNHEAFWCQNNLEKGTHRFGKRLERDWQEIGKRLERDWQETGKSLERGWQEIGKRFSPNSRNGAEALSWPAFRSATASPDTDVSQEQSSAFCPTFALIYRNYHDQYRHTTNSTHFCFVFCSHVCVLLPGHRACRIQTEKL